jgi:oligopeptide/dipeptide ABC transporter ATP-binding protein
MNAPLLEVADLSVVYKAPSRRGRDTIAVDDVTLAVPRGKTVGLVGESGSGKTSLGWAILGLAPVSAGSVLFDGEEIADASGASRRRLARRMQVVYQDPYGSLNPARRIRDTIGETLRFNLGLEPDEVAERVARVLDEVGLPASAGDGFPAHFSGGQRQRVAIARAIVSDPEFILCDEPVSALDLSVQAQVLNLLARLRADRNLSYLFISHDLSVVRYLSDEIAVMYSGRIVERGPAAIVAGSAVHPYTRALIAASPVPDPRAQARNRAARRAFIGNAQADGRATEACVFAARCPYATDLCRSERPLLAGRGQGHEVACHYQDELAGARDFAAAGRREPA